MDDICTSCLCEGRNLYFLNETGSCELYSQILSEISMYGMSELCVRICWECKAVLRRFQIFKDQVKRSYTELLRYAEQDTPSKISLIKQPSIQIQHLDSINYPHIKVKAEPDDIFPIEIKEETEHCEPETFVNDLNVEEYKEKRSKTKEKTKKPKEKKIRVKKKTKIKKKNVPSSDESINIDNGVSDVESDYYAKEKVEEKGIEVEVEVQKEAEDCVEQLTNCPIKEKANGVVNKLVDKEMLSERPQCVECGKVFSSRKTYRYHLNVLHKGQNRYPCPRCGKVYQWKSNLGRHMRSHKARDSGELYCETCDKRFASVATYRQHLRVSRRHVPESEFSFMCNECGKKFVNKTRLRDHIDWEHLKKIKFRCQLCNKPFKCHTSLYVHMQNVHRNKEKKDNLCHVCGKSYQNAAKLKYHIVAMHTSETPYQCQECTAAFGWYSSLYRHIREVHYKMKVQPKKSKKSKKLADTLPLIPPPQLVLPQIHQPGPA